MLCFAKFNEEKRKSQFEEFWASADRKGQRRFLICLSQELPAKRIRVGSGKRLPLPIIIICTKLVAQATKEEVCRTFFINSQTSSETLSTMDGDSNPLLAG
ncbi:hypothetical protein RRG08_008860 [Elysia crispata]|uniref:Uncharacterized protein n=1 Tax=Elysia crispata TaxID=231223 RepID=A0AAE0ZWS7_9GAST|nr:hypothetical protein RRG08_008860 [Elysia crispata]